MYPSERTKHFEELTHTIIRNNYKMTIMRNEDRATSKEYHTLLKQNKSAKRELDTIRR